MKKYIFFLALLFVLFPSAAFAFSTTEIITYGNPEVVYRTLQSATTLINDGYLNGLFATVVGFCCFYALFYIGLYTKDWRRAILYFLYFPLVYSIMIVPKSNFTVVNKYPPNETFTLNNVPFELGYVASFFTNVSDQISSRFDQFYSVPDSFKCSEYGLTFSLKAINSAVRYGPSSSYLIMNVTIVNVENKFTLPSFP